MKKIYTCFLLFFISYLALYAQMFYKLKDIIISNQDTVIKTYILIKEKTFQPKLDLTYYWYRPNQINKNKAGFTGNLVHGKYLVFNTNKQLIQHGYFKKGLKDGIWKEWDENSELIMITEWKNGKIHGEHKKYNNIGQLEFITHYKKGIKNGKECLFYLNNESICNKYKKGKLVIEKKKEKQKKQNTDSLKIKNNSIECDSVSKLNKNASTVTPNNFDKKNTKSKKTNQNLTQVNNNSNIEINENQNELTPKSSISTEKNRKSKIKRKNNHQ